MGQKTNPIGFRLGVTRTWDSRWFAKKNYSELLHEDILIRKVLKKKLYQAGVSKIEIERAANKVKVNIYSARPGLIIGKKGSGVDSLRAETQALTKNESSCSTFLKFVSLKSMPPWYRNPSAPSWKSV